MVYAFTMGMAALSLVLRLIKPLRRLQRTTGGMVQTPIQQTNLSQATSFAAAICSTIGWLVSSPATVRMIAASGLDVLALAAFSFAQGLYISLQRALPGLLILPSLEPIIMAQVSSGHRREKIYTTFSVIFKTELICVLAALIATTIAGREHYSNIVQPAYGTYYYVTASNTQSHLRHRISHPRNDRDHQF